MCTGARQLDICTLLEYRTGLNIVREPTFFLWSVDGMAYPIVASHTIALAVKSCVGVSRSRRVYVCVPPATASTRVLVVHGCRF